MSNGSNAWVLFVIVAILLFLAGCRSYQDPEMHKWRMYRLERTK